jgi:hypothetical protein
MSKKEEVEVKAIIEVINMDEFALLDTKLQTKIIAITKELNLSSVAKFNPLVKAIIDIDKFKLIKYKDEPDTIQEFKDAKAIIKTFRASVKKTKTAIKKPMLLTGKGLDAIEKTFIADATAVLDYLELEFKPFLDKEESKKIAAQEKKDKAKNSQIAELSQESMDNKVVIARMNAYAAISKRISAYTNTASEQVKTYSKEALQEELNFLSVVKLDISLADQMYLLDDQVKELEESFLTSIRSSKALLTMKINEVPSLAADVIQSASPLMAPSISDNNPNYIRDSIIAAVKQAVLTISNLNPALAIEKDAVIKTTAGLNHYVVLISKFFEE